MSPTVFAVVLLAAALHATWNVIVKASGDKMLSAAAVVGSAALIALFFIPFTGPPAPASWPFLAASTVLQTIYLALVARAYHVANMSRTYPLMRGVAPLVVTIFGILLLGEHLVPLALLGVAAIGFGILSMGLDERGADSGKGRGIALLNAVVIAGYTLVDGVGVRLSGAPVAYILFVFLLNGIVFAGWMLATRAREFVGFLRTNWHLGLAGGVGTLISYGLALWAMTLAPVAAVAALRETSILFGTAIAGLVLKERIGPWRAAGAVVITLGAILIRLA